MHGKGSLLAKMPGDDWQKFANLRALYAYMWAHPGKKLLFMGGELAQEREWNDERSLDWHLLEHAAHAGIQSLVRDLNRAYKAEPALWEVDFDAPASAGSRRTTPTRTCSCFVRCSRDGERVARRASCNLSPVPRHGYRVGLPRGGRWVELLNTDSSFYGGSDVGNLGGGRGRGAPVARPAVLGRGHAAAARRRLARPRGAGALTLGAVPRPDGTTEFSVWAAERRLVSVRAGGEEHPLEPEAAGSVRRACPSQRHRLRLRRRRPRVRRPVLALPAARGCAGRRASSSSRFEIAPGPELALDELVIYELHVGTFSAEGTFDGVDPAPRASSASSASRRSS